MAAIHSSRIRSASDPFVDPLARQRPPPPPPKPRMQTTSRNSSQHDITEAVRDNTRSKINRSSLPPAGGLSTSRPPGKRTQSEDNVDKPPRSSGKSGKSRSKKGSKHADVIDRLDFTGVGPMFHHDGPFDACAPSRNKHRNQAPLNAWVGGPGDLSAPQYGDSAYPSPNAYKAFTNDYPEPPKKKVDAIAEAWGIHEPEPFEEFFAGGGTGRADGDTPASSIYNGRDSHSTSRSGPTQKRPKDPREDARSRAPARRSLVPPPQPIFVGEPADLESPTGSPPPTSPGFPKRSKSLMYRIRKMRDSPNVPVAPDYEQPSSPSSPTDPVNAYRQAHRPQHSFLGRFGGSSRANQTPTEKSEPFVYIDTPHNKDLPAPPPLSEAQPIAEESEPQDYFDSHGGGGSSPGGLGRKTSLMKKVGRVVRGTK